MMEAKDRQRLRALAAHQLELANSAVNLERIAQWKRHNAVQPGRPLVHVELDTFEQEVVDPLLQCVGEEARQLERDLLRGTVNLELFDDDWVVNDWFPVQWQGWFHLFGHDIGRTSAVGSDGTSLGHHFNHVISDLEEDWGKLWQTTFGVDEAATSRYRTLAEETFGDILPVRMGADSLQAVPTQKVVHRMGMEAMFFNMSDYPELFTKMMERIADDYLAYFAYLEQSGYLNSTTGGELLRQGSRCYTHELPDKENPRLREVWGFMDSQESQGLSPQMFHELVFPCYQRIAEQFGLLSYGCCEAVHPFWEDLRTLPNLRKLSISPWCNQQMMGEQLRDSRIIFHRKPSPNFLGMGTTLDEAAVVAHIQETMDAARGCVVEFTQRDVYTINHDVAKVRRYVELIRKHSM